jgi:hypothetical protein
MSALRRLAAPLILAPLLTACLSNGPGMTSRLDKTGAMCGTGDRGDRCATAFYPMHATRLMMTVRAGSVPADTAPDPACTAARGAESARSNELASARSAAAEARGELSRIIAQIDAALLSPPERVTAQVEFIAADVSTSVDEARRAALQVERSAKRADSAAAFRARRCAASLHVDVEITRHDIVERYVSLRVPESAAERMDYELRFDADGRLQRVVNAPQSGLGELAQAIGESGAALASFQIGFRPGGAILQSLNGMPAAYGSPPAGTPGFPPGPTVAEMLEEQREIADTARRILDRYVAGAETAGEAAPPPQPALPFIRVFDPTAPDSMTELHAALWGNSLPLVVRVDRQGQPSAGPRLFELAQSDEEFVGVLVRESLDYAVRVSQLAAPGEFVLDAEIAAARPELFAESVSCALGYGYDGYCELALPREARTFYAGMQAFENEGAVRTLPIWRNAWANTTTTVDFAGGDVTIIDSERPAPATEPFRASSRLLNGFVTSLTGNLQNQNSLAQQRTSLMESQIRLLETEARLQSAIDEAEAARLAREAAEAENAGGSPD